MLGSGTRGALLEVTLTKLKKASPDTKIVSMSATILNLRQVADFLDADVFENNFRPVNLDEFVKIGNVTITEVNSCIYCFNN